jgi:TRAP-type C4-dicarboxylate transport system substrate-binding protein
LARTQGKQVGPGRGARAVKGARRLWPYVLMAWERWQALSPEEKERYKRRAREYAERGRKAAERGRDALEERRRRKKR